MGMYSQVGLNGVGDIGQAKPFPPDSQSARVNYIRRNRRLWQGDFDALRVGSIDEGIVGLKLNWFRRLTTFYPQFLLGEQPIITTDNERFNEYIRGIERHLWRIIQCANMDSIRYGYGVVASHPEAPPALWTVEPDHHFVVVDDLGNPTHDLLLRVRGYDTDQRLDIYVYDMEGNVERRVHAYNAGAVGGRLRTITLPSRAAVRQVFELPLNPQRASMFDDIAGNIGEMSRASTSLARSVRRNAHPHLYGPDGLIRADASGNSVLDVEGMFLPLQQGDQTPGYLQWDSKLDAVNADFRINFDNMLSMTGLTRVLFEPEALTGVASGTALRRLLLTFVATLNDMKEENNVLVESILAVINENNAARGMELFDYSDVSIEYPYERIFEDVPIQQLQQQAAEEGNEPE